MTEIISLVIAISALLSTILHRIETSKCYGIEIETRKINENENKPLLTEINKPTLNIK